jgi:hypothetical protein
MHIFHRELAACGLSDVPETHRRATKAPLVSASEIGVR